MAASVVILAAALTASMTGYSSALAPEDVERFTALRALQLAYGDLTAAMSMVVFLGTVVALSIQVLRSFVIVSATTSSQRGHNFLLILAGVVLVIVPIVPGYGAARTMVCTSAVQRDGTDRLASARLEKKGDEAAIRQAARLSTPVRPFVFHDCTVQQNRWNVLLATLPEWHPHPPKG
jgi:hypothetical protein